MREWNINDVFDELKQLSKDEKWNNYSLKYVRNCLIRTLFNLGYPFSRFYSRQASRETLEYLSYSGKRFKLVNRKFHQEKTTEKRFTKKSQTERG